MAVKNPPEIPLLLRAIVGIYAWLAFVLIATLSLLPLLFLPTLTARRRLIRWAAYAALYCTGIRISAHGLKQLPLPCVVVANHESYLDGVLLAATLPPVFGFVIKREMHSVPAAGWLLARIGAFFVARNNGRGSKRDTLRVLRSASDGQALAFFPEGTFKPEAGLLNFHNGAFVAAQRASLPLVPLVIRGTRRCMSPRLPLPWPGRISVRALATIPHAASREAAELRVAARDAILAASGLPDARLSSAGGSREPRTQDAL
jgi:1-acyl-sn-glycerol-3-phosphate acyltransferase